MALERPSTERERRVSENQVSVAGSRVHRDTWNLDGRRGDHVSRCTLDTAAFTYLSHTRLSRSMDGLSSAILLDL